MLVMMACDADRHGADHVRRRHHHGAPPGPRAVLAARRQRAGPARRRRADRLAHGAAVPRDAARIDTVNRVLREQISGIRVVRAFVREPDEQRRFADANDELTTTALRAGRLMALMFPTVMLVLNVSSVAVLWFGAHRVAAATSQIGSLTAFLTYLVQILMSVMMATFMPMMMPRAAVCAERIQEVLDTDSSVAPPVAPIESGSLRGEVELRDVEFRYPGADDAVLRGISLHAHRRPDHGDRRQHRRRQDDAALADPTAVRRHLGRGARRRRGRARSRSGAAVEADRTGAADARTCSPGPSRATCATATRTPPTTSCGSALEIAQARDFVEAMPDGLDGPDRAGRHERLRRPAAAPRDRPRAGAQAGDLPVRRLVLGARSGDGRPAAGGAAPAHPRRRPC